MVYTIDQQWASKSRSECFDFQTTSDGLSILVCLRQPYVLLLVNCKVDEEGWLQ